MKKLDVKKIDTRKLAGTIIGGIVFLCCILFFTYAFYQWKSSNTEVVLGIEDLYTECVLGEDVIAENIGPVLDFKEGVIAEFSISNGASSSEVTTLELVISSITDNLKNESFKYVLVYDTDGGTNYDYDNPVLSGTFEDMVLGSNTITSALTIEGNATYSYQFIVYIDGNMYNDPSIQGGSLVSSLYVGSCGTSAEVGVNAGEYIQSLYDDGSSLTTVNIGNSTDNLSVSLNATQGIMLDNNGEYRYYGADPNNYVSYNGELWRIISVSNVKSSSSDATGEMRVKLIRSEAIGSYSWDSSASTVNSGSGVNDWSQADIKTELNDLYYNSQSGTCYNYLNDTSVDCDFTNTGLNTSAQNMIGDAVYYLGGIDMDSIMDGEVAYASDYYNDERGTAVYDCTVDDGVCPRATSWTGKVGLVYPSDFMYATDLGLCSKDSYSYSTDTNCYQNDWILLDSNGNDWSITSVINNEWGIINFGSTGDFYANGVAAFQANIRPVVYLKSVVTIASGTGTAGNPYQLSVGGFGDAFIEKVLKVNAQSDADIDFSETSEESDTNGVYLRSGTEDDTNSIYYYRGAVDNNLIFADVCWKIVRTTSTGGLKLIYNGTPTNGQCNNTGTASQIGTSAFNSYNSVAYAGYMYSSPYTYTSKTMTSITDTYYYGNDVTYSNGTYTLTDTITNSDWSTIYNGGLNNYHYTCFSTETTCNSVYYIYYTYAGGVCYITLTNGKKIEDALVDMLGADDSNTSNYNTTSSTIKGNSTTAGTIDYWYYNNIEQKGYSNYLEDTVWCNDRTISEKNGWDPDGGNTLETYLYFSSYKRLVQTYEPSLKCSRTIDSFTVSEINGNGDLDYPVGLLTADEVVLAGGKNGSSNGTYYLYTGQSYRVSSPSTYYYYSMFGFLVNSSGNLGDTHWSNAHGVRPSVSLKPGFLVSEGNGTVTRPYIVS